MSNWYGTARSNYVRFKDEAAFEAARKLVQACNMTWHADGAPLCAMISGEEDTGAFNWSYTDDDDEIFDIDPSYVARFMESGQVLVLMEAGAEKLRYVSGWAEAWSTEGDCVSVNLNDIYTRAFEAFKVRPTDATYMVQPV